MNDRLMRIIFSLLNMLGIAGVGTYLAGRKHIGVIQIVLSLSFFSLTLGSMLFLFALIKDTEGVSFFAWQIGVFQGEYDFHRDYWKPFSVALISITLFGINLLWSLTTTKPASSSPPPIT
ncbi:MAG: hypothetical protein AAF649_06430 [Verrucomicrobiota bacterium]